MGTGAPILPSDLETEAPALNERAADFAGHPEPKSLVVLRFGVFLVTIVSAGAVFAVNMTDQTLWMKGALEAAVVILLGLAALFAIGRAQHRMRKEAASIRSVWHDRQEELHEIASRDDLTQLQNRRFFYDRLQEELDYARNQKRALSVIMLDVDDLKAVNDEFGHQIGDAVLRGFARVLNSHANHDWVTARLGGDEFAVIMPGADRKEADSLAWKLWEELSHQPICETDHASIYLGVSAGTSGFPWGGNDIEEIIHWADTKLYANKLERKGFKQQRDTRNDGQLVSAVVDVLSSALDVRDRMTHRHARRVARMAACVARQMGLNDEQILEVEHAAALHDIGKIGVADQILRKSAALDDEEWREMRRHCELGYQILNGIDFLRTAAEIVYSHHERWDGSGYPRGLEADEIPLGARVFSVVDAFDAMTSRRPYRDAMPREVALMEIARNAGSQFDPVVVDTFLVVARSNPDGFQGDEDDYGPHVTSANDAPYAHNGHTHQRQPAAR